MYFPSYSVEIEEIAAYLATVSSSGKLKGGLQETIQSNQL
ncbi:hypothetical protein PR001_g28455 [Phytophthora rubi]|uniref:Uncharacterized protein n=1 Tax=Phytophthora rubi TaxID=129364 RepID=A0A6A3HBK7_9STRA|nr:hypothetical protein PR001_g28455 [Phytophthora rubi]